MGFSSPMWLLGLLPWAVAVFYLLPGSGAPAIVPFLGLWQAGAAVSKRTARRWPGVAALLAMLALLLMILAAAQPVLLRAGISDDEVTIVLDRGATMALPSASGRPFRNVISRMSAIADRTRVNLIPVPGEPIATTGDTWAKTAGAMSPTAIAVQLDQTVVDQLHKTQGPVFVLSDQKLKVRDDRIVQILPETVTATVAITAIGAGSSPHPQVMLRIENLSDAVSVPVVLQSGDATVRRDVPLAAKGKSTDQFLDLPVIGATVKAKAEFRNQQSPWLTAYLVWQSSGVRIAVDPEIDPAVRRLVEIYTRHRHAGPNAMQILVSNHALDRDQPGICAIDSSDARAGSPTVVAHAVTRNVRNWPGTGTAWKIPPGFTPLVWVGSSVVVAVREESARQLWINADLSDWQNTPDFVVFFADALAWIGGGDSEYASVPPGLTREQPGIFQVDGNQSVAVNAGDLPAINLAEKATAGESVRAGGKISVSEPMIFAALACLLVAAILWPLKR